MMLKDEEQEPASLCIASVKTVLAVLQAVRARVGNKNQFCTMLLGSDGLSVRWEDDSKSLQSSVFLKPNVFAEFSCPDPRRVLGLSLSTLMDTLGVFASGSSELKVRYPGANGELVMETTEHFGGVDISSYARINSQETPLLRDLADYWEEPSSYFLGQGQLFKEVIDDLEWAGGNVRLHLQRDPPEISFSADGSSSGNGRLGITLPVPDLQGFSCAEAEVEHFYPLKRLQTAFTNLPITKDPSQVSTKVTIDAQGLMKVAHMVGMQPGPGAATAFQSSQASGPVGVVQFLLLAADIDAEEG